METQPFPKIYLLFAGHPLTPWACHPVYKTDWVYLTSPTTSSFFACCQWLVYLLLCAISPQRTPVNSSHHPSFLPTPLWRSPRKSPEATGANCSSCLNRPAVVGWCHCSALVLSKTPLKPVTHSQRSCRVQAIQYRLDLHTFDPP